MNIKDCIEDYIEFYKDEIVKNICEFVRIPSLACEDESEYPYGRECAKALDFCMNLSREKGLYVKNHEYYCSEAQIERIQNGKRLVIAAHADVVPGEENCIYSPFGGDIIGDYIVGRGVVDNKAPLIATIYALAFFKKHNIKLNNDIRLLFGSNEELGMDDIDYYLEKVGQPDFALAVDDDFPVVNGEKGLVKFSLSALKAKELSDISSSGKAQRIVHDECVVKLENDSFIEIRKSPEDNVVSKLIQQLWENDVYILNNYDKNKALIEILKDPTGKLLHIQWEDERSGKTSIKIYKVSMEEDKVVFDFDVRVPITYDEDTIIDRIIEFAEKLDFEYEIKKVSPSFYLPEEHEIVKLLTDLYNEASKSNDKPYVMGACTYARKFKEACGFGAGNQYETKPFPKGHGSAHGADEAQNINVLLNAIRMYILGIKAIDDKWSLERELQIS